jgi:hypothetical protein
MTTIFNYCNCKKLKNQKVRVITRQGVTHIGTVVKVDDKFIYLRPVRPKDKANVSFFPIIPLVLFDLLAIFLVTTPFYF